MRTMRTQADRDFELELGRVMERRGAEIARLRAEMALIEPAYEELRATVNRLSDERQHLRTEIARLRALLKSARPFVEHAVEHAAVEEDVDLLESIDTALDMSGFYRAECVPAISNEMSKCTYPLRGTK